jgi:uncharacterized protein (DUF885 family)
MTPFRRAAAAIIITPAFALPLAATAAHAATPDYDATVKAYIDAEALSHPVNATSLGLHAGDAQMDAVSPAFHAAEVKRLHATLASLAAVDTSKLSRPQLDDREILTAEIGGELLEEEHVQQWRHNPDTYVGLVTNGPYSLIARNFAPASVRLQAAIARETAIPAIFAAAKENLTDMPPVFIDIALEDVNGAADFLGHDLPAAFTSVNDPKAQAELAATTQKAVAASKDFAAWLTAQKPAAHGSFVLGPDNFRRLLDADMIDLTPAQVLAAGRAQLQKDHDDFLAVSRALDPAKPADALKLVEADHPDGAHLISVARDQLAMLHDFIVAKHIIDLPGQDLPKVAETPQFQRAIVFGEMDPPGPFETHATQAYYYITPPDLSKSKAEQEEYLSYFNNALLLNLGVHEALPGHFVQYLYMRANPDWSLVRKTGHSYTATEGWAHYSEQMMQKQGLLDNNPKLHLAQLQDALLRDCRLVASVEMHTGGMSLADAAKMMADQCFQPPPVAYKEARRGTSDPGYFSYTLGKLMILKLRADAEAKEGKSFTLAHFHDRFLNAGLIPLKIIRREIMDADGPLL